MLATVYEGVVWSMKEFTDQSHIEHIRKKLWSGREFGQAAVMVGTGFSRNAEKISASVPRFPLWQELANTLFDALYPIGAIPDKEREKKKLETATVGESLKLASEYEALFGRTALDGCIIDAVPDNDYNPGKLHELLLSLPWSNVFTTNYDTLLERTRILERKYELILTASDIPGRSQPRIIKLHGSFPSHRPFIVTQEDYRTYPRKYAPFVNMVQQAIMENIFCLIGFSGEDPNFLHWTGWVRDNLGESMPPVYLCGLLNITPSQRKLLESRKVFPIDLSPLFPEADWPDREIRHSKAIEWFLLNLMYGAPPNILLWPMPPNANAWKPSLGLPPVPPSSYPLSGVEKTRPNSNTQDLSEEELRNIYKCWKEKRLEYPGWVIAPDENRENLWMHTKYWINPLLNSIGKLSEPERLHLLFELNWRLEKTLTPLLLSWVEKIVPILELFNPFPRVIEIKEARIRPDIEEYRYLDWGIIGMSWVELVFAIVREAREDQDELRFRLWMDRINSVVRQSEEWQARWYYEECLFALHSFDQERIREIFVNWPKTPHIPFWDVKRAAIMAELGELREAEKITDAALSEIRTKLRPYSNDYNLLSQEGWAMLLLKAIKESLDFRLVSHYKDRWEKLGSYRCNPWTEIETMQLRVSISPPVPSPEKEVKKQFDPGHISVRRHYTGEPDFFQFRPAFAFLRMYEEGAVPVVCGNIGLFNEAAINASKWIAPFAPLWSFSIMLRTGKDSEIKERFNRVYIASLSDEEVNHFYNLLMKAVNQSLRYLTEKPDSVNIKCESFSQRNIKLLLELLSRLSFRFSDERLHDLFKLALRIYKLPIIRQTFYLHECVKSLFQRLLFAMPQSEVLKRMADLLSLPLPGENGFDVSDPKHWEEPFYFLYWQEDTKMDANIDRSSWTPIIQNLINVVAKGSADARGRAALRLDKLFEINGLSVEEVNAYGNALWSRVDSVKGLPNDTDFYDFAFLCLPEPIAGTAKEKFRKYIISAKIPHLIEKSTGSDGKIKKSLSSASLDSNRRYFNECLGGTVPLLPRERDIATRVDWTADEAVKLLELNIEWWNEEKEELSDENLSFLDRWENIRESFSQICNIMSDVVLPRLKTADDRNKQAVIALVSDMERAGLCVLSVLPMLLFIDSNRYDDISQKLRFGLSSTKEEEVKESILGLFVWLVHGSKNNLLSPPVDLLNELVNIVLTRRQPGLDYAIRYISVIVKKLPSLLTEEHLRTLCVALEYLIKVTELPDKFQRNTKDSSTVPTDYLPEYRKLAAELAYRLFVLFSETGKEIPSVLKQWREICQIDTLPEVRRAWH